LGVIGTARNIDGLSASASASAGGGGCRRIGVIDAVSLAIVVSASVKADQLFTYIRTKIPPL
jgi:hypothetical protein